MVYEYIIKPACKRGGFEPVRADDINRTNDIAIDVIRRLVDSPMAVCDLSSRNPNVMYELGLRHAFNRPVTLLKDSLTPRVFDVQGLRDLEYDASLRVDTIEPTVFTLAQRIQNTYEAFTTSGAAAGNSLVQLIGISEAPAPQHVELSEGTALVLAAVNEIRTRLGEIENRIPVARTLTAAERDFRRGVGLALQQIMSEKGTRIRHKLFGEGTVTDTNPQLGTMVIEFADPNVGRKTIKAAYTTLEVLDSPKT